MLMKMTEIFGNQPSTIRTIKQCIDDKLEGKTNIDPQVSTMIKLKINLFSLQTINEIQEDIQNALYSKSPDMRKSQRRVQMLEYQQKKRQSQEHSISNNFNSRRQSLSESQNNIKMKGNIVGIANLLDDTKSRQNYYHTFISPRYNKK